MALRPPNPLLATETITIDIRTLSDDSHGGQSFVDGATVTYPAIVTQQVLNRDGLKARGGGTLSECLWDILIFNISDPGVLPQKTKMTVNVQNRVIIAQTLSTQREAGCWYVLGKSTE